MNIKKLFPIIHINIETNKAVLNDLAKELFENVNEIEEMIKNIDLNKKTDFAYISNQLYLVNILKGIKTINLIFSQIEDSSLVSIHTDQGVNIDIYKKDVLREFLEKFLALKRRYGGFNVKFLYLKVDFTLNLSLRLKREYLHKILKYTIAVTRSSDVVGQITENSFGIILTNSTSNGANVVSNKILKFVSELNTENKKRVIEVYGTLAHELFILKNTNFEEFIKELDEHSEFITLGIKLKELIK